MLKPNLISVIHHIAIRTGTYEKYNLNVIEQPFSSGQSAAGIEALLRGDVDFYIGAGAEVVRANSEALAQGLGQPLVVLGGGTSGITSFVLRKDLNIHTIDDLRGKNLKIGVSSPSSIHLALFRGSLLKEGKHDPDQLGLQFIRTAASDMLPALTTKQLDGFMHSEPTTTLAIQSDIGYVFLNARRGDMGPVGKIVPTTFISANKAWLEKNPEAAERYMKAILEAGDIYEKLPKNEAVKILAEWSRQEEDIINLSHERVVASMRMSPEAAQGWWDIIADGMRIRGEISETLRMDQVFDMRYQK